MKHKWPWNPTGCPGPRWDSAVSVRPREMIEMSVIQLFPRFPAVKPRQRQFLPDLGGDGLCMKGRIKGGIWETINFSTGGHQPITSSLIAAEAASPNTGGEAIKLISRVVHGPSWYMDGGIWWVHGTMYNCTLYIVHGWVHGPS